MQKTFLARLQSGARNCLIGALLLILGIPLYQFLLLVPSGYSNALNSQGQTMAWIHANTLLFLGYRALLILGFALMLSMPFALFRIIVAQEILGREEEPVEVVEDEEDEELAEEETGEIEEKSESVASQPENSMPEFAWRGKGFAVLATWMELIGLLVFVLGTLGSTFYYLMVSFSSNYEAPLSGLFAIVTFTIGGGLLAFACLFFGAMIARSGRKLWPDSWVFFSYLALAIAAVMCGSAVEVAFNSTGQPVLSTFAIFLFGLWVLWYGVMVVRLRAE